MTEKVDEIKEAEKSGKGETPVEAMPIEGEPAEEEAAGEPAEQVEEGEDELAALRRELEELRAQAAEYLDGWQRARAEFANYKKRQEQERAELLKAGNAALIAKLLPVLDDFDRAFETVPEDLADAPWLEGMRLVRRKFWAALEQEGVTPIKAEGQPFDPELHEAITHEETSEHPPEHVIAEVQKGYRLGDGVLRPSMVRVAKAPAEAEKSESERESG